jgi:hexulose-6-phosphate isomerase
MDRRSFVTSCATFAALSSLAVGATAAGPGAKRAHKKGFMLGTLRSDTAKKLSLAEKLQLVRGAGFQGVEVDSGLDQAEVLAARDRAGLEIAGVVIATHWSKPLSDPDPTARKAGLDGLLQGLRDAKAYGADTVLLVPAVVKKDVSYADAYARSAAEIAKAVPLAESLGVAIALENVWNQFLLSPREAAEFVDTFKSRQVRWYFDVGNIVNTGWPEHWIRQLGPRIARVHVKEFSRKLRDARGPRAGFEAELLGGDCDWPAVMAALDTIGYTSWLTVEQHRPANLSDAEWLAGLSAALDRIKAS